MRRKSNPWVALVALILLLVLVVCICTGCDDTAEAVKTDGNRFVCEQMDKVAGTMGARVITDTETGVRYLVISYGQGIGVTKLEEANQ